MTMRWTQAIVVTGLGAALAGCGGGHDDLKAYVAKIEKRPASKIEPIPESPPYKPYDYDADGRRAPFTPTAPERDEPTNNGIAPDADRKREPLEAFPLDALRMVGTISRGGVRYALIQAPDNVVHRARPGNHLGQNYGRIDAVSADGVLLTEIVPDGRGGFTRRPATIAFSR